MFKQCFFWNVGGFEFNFKKFKFQNIFLLQISCKDIFLLHFGGQKCILIQNSLPESDLKFFKNST